MTSAINPNNIDGAYPVAGQDNNSQGFRDNFTNTATNFQYAADEISDLQAKVVLKEALTGTTLNNDMGGSVLSNAELQDMSETVVALGTVAGSMSPVMGVPESTNNGIVINGKEVDKASLEVDGVDSRDYPDFSDAYFSAGSFTDGTPLSDEEIDQLSDQYGDLLYDKAYDSLHEGNTLLARIKSLALIR